MLHRMLAMALLLAITAGDPAAQTPQEAGSSPARLDVAAVAASEKASAQRLIDEGRLAWREDPGRALELAREALSRLDSNREAAAAADANELAARSLLSLEAYDEALDHLAGAQQLYTRLGDTKMRARCLGYEAMARSKLGQLWPAIDAATAALELFREIGDDRGIAATANNLGIYYERAGEYERALELNLDALERERGLGHEIGIANSLNSVGNIYSRVEEHEKAREYYLQALELFERLGESYGTAQVLNNLGNTYEKLDQDGTALDYYRRALAAAEADGRVAAQAAPLTNLGILHKKQGRYEEALASHRRVAGLQRALGDKAGLALSLQHSGEVLVLMGRLEEAEVDLRQSEAISLDIGSNAILDTTYLTLADVAERRADYRLAYQLLQRYGEVRAALLDEEKTRAIAQLEARYEAERRREEIELLHKDNDLLRKDGEIRRLELSRARLTAALLAIAVVVLVAGVAFIARRYRWLLAFWRRRSFIGPYRLTEKIAEGGMGVVYRAVSVVEPSQTVALKVIREELAGDETQRRRFLNEGRIIDVIDHPNIVKVFERGEQNDRLYIAMELLEGRTLADLIADSARQQEMISESSCVAMMRQLGSAVQTIHAHGVVHRDIKPNNVVLVSGQEGDPTVKLLDFGVARSATMTSLTEAGEILGTMTYLAPERLQHRPPVPASDIFSLGVVYYELLTLERPFPGEDPVALLSSILDREPQHPGRLRPGLNDQLADLVMAMLRKDPASRPDGEEVVHRLERFACSGAAS